MLQKVFITIKETNGDKQFEGVDIVKPLTKEMSEINITVNTKNLGASV